MHALIPERVREKPKVSAFLEINYWYTYVVQISYLKHCVEKTEWSFFPRDAYTTNKVNIGGDILRYWGDWWRYWGMKDWHHDGCWLLLSLTRELSDIQTRNLYPSQLLTSFTPFSHAVSHFHQRITCEGPFVQCNDIEYGEFAVFIPAKQNISYCQKYTSIDPSSIKNLHSILHMFRTCLLFDYV